MMIDFGNHYCVAQIWVLSLGTCCPPREQRLLVSCSPIPHHVIPEGPLGAWQELLEGNYFYADKTAIVYQLAHYAKFHFLSRPRRFGKSLFVSTLKAYFEGKKELFKGLAIEQMEKEWTVYPVILLDLSCGKYYSLENAKIILDNILKVEEQKYGIEVPESGREGFGARFRNILLAAKAQTGKQVVVLIDEYDAPMHDSISDEELQKTIRNIMRDFFSPLKQQEGNIRFVFITGISKFSQLSIFCELNNLKILTLKDEYSSCCGITKSELTQYFREGIEEMAEHNGLTYEETLQQLGQHYDGYHFSIEI